VPERLALRVEPARRGRARIERGVILVAQDAGEEAHRVTSVGARRPQASGRGEGMAPERQIRRAVGLDTPRGYGTA